MEKIVLISGGYDPLHSGHLAYIKHAGEIGRVVVGVNSDDWLARKKGRAFMPIAERLAIMNSLKGVMIAIPFDDADGSALDAITQTRKIFPNNTIVFANGGDRTPTNIPEMGSTDPNVEFAFGIGGEHKKNSSSWLLEEWSTPRTSRPWGYYRVLYSPNPNVKLKELTVEPGQRLSMQRHQDRAEHWFVAEGTATVYTIDSSTDLLGHYQTFDSIHIQKTQWHQLCNETDQPLRVVEIQYGQRCVEEDIERQ